MVLQFYFQIQGFYSRNFLRAGLYWPPNWFAFFFFKKYFSISHVRWGSLVNSFAFSFYRLYQYFGWSLLYLFRLVLLFYQLHEMLASIKFFKLNYWSICFIMWNTYCKSILCCFIRLLKLLIGMTLSVCLRFSKMIKLHSLKALGIKRALELSM